MIRKSLYRDLEQGFMEDLGQPSWNLSILPLIRFDSYVDISQAGLSVLYHFDSM
jgi:hypothetical protein